MRSRRPRTSAGLIALGLLLLASVAVGRVVGERALFGVTERRVPVTGPLTTPIVEPTVSEEPVSKNWKRDQIVSVPTDPGFPDPRVTRPPPPEPTARPTPKPTPSPTPADEDSAPAFPLFTPSPADTEAAPRPAAT